MGFLNEFQKFAMRGNVVDLAVGVVIGGAFGKITTSLVNDVLMPPIGLLTGGVDFSHWKIPIGPDNPTTEAIDPVTINLGEFINTMVNFLIVAFAIFLVIRVMNRLHEATFGPDEKQPSPAVNPPEDILLLREIRDSLKKQA
ncbi:large-conductance mechanosensitive channel protein MscL [Botrimarina sp.]|uniref:large-conductance mechanosensitive channel protein MscL n=1 Tax=Botrimarina sp. TaxID=2795802 RepID=UPI0032ECEA34